MGDVIDFNKRVSEIAQEITEQPIDAGDVAEFEYEAKPGSVAVKVAAGGDGIAHMTITVPGEDIGEALDMALESLLRNFGVDPADEQGRAVVREQMGEPTYNAFLTTFVQQRFLTQALMRTKMMSFLDPDFLTGDMPRVGEDYEFRVDVVIRPSYQLTSYDPVDVERPEPREITSKDVTAYLDNMSHELSTWEEDTSRDIAEDGDRVRLNLDSTVDGRTVRELSGRHIEFVMGSGIVGEDFDRELAGIKVRERREFSVSLPTRTQDGSVAYQVVNVKAQLDCILKKVPARIDDAWVLKNFPEAQTLLGLRSRVRTMLEREAAAQEREELMARCADELAKRIVGPIDDLYVQKMRDQLITQFVQDLAQSGISYADYMAQPGFDHDEWVQQMTQDARESLARGLALDSLADHLDINLDVDDIAKVVSQMAPGQEEEAYKGLLDSGQMPKMCEVALRLRANEWLVDHLPAPRKAKDPKGSSSILLGGSDKPRDSKGDGPKLQLF